MDRLIESGADEVLAALIAVKVSESLAPASEVGGEDPVVDGQRLQDLEHRQDEIEEPLAQTA